MSGGSEGAPSPATCPETGHPWAGLKPVTPASPRPLGRVARSPGYSCCFFHPWKCGKCAGFHTAAGDTSLWLGPQDRQLSPKTSLLWNQSTPHTHLAERFVPDRSLRPTVACWHGVWSCLYCGSMFATPPDQAVQWEEDMSGHPDSRRGHAVYFGQ